MISFPAFCEKRTRGPELTFITDIDGSYASISNHWHPNGNFVAAGLLTGGAAEITVYSFDGTNLSAVETVNLGNTIRSVEWSPSGNFLAVASYISGAQVKVYSWNGTDTLAEVESVSYGANADSISWHPSEDFLAVAGSYANSELIVYSWNGTDTLASVETVNYAEFGYGAEWSPSGDYLAFAHGDGIVVYGWNGTDTLTSKDSVSLGVWAKWLSWTSDDAYVALGSSSATKNIAIYSFDGTNLVEKTSTGFGAGYRATVDFDSTNTYLFSGIFTSGVGATNTKYIIMYEWDNVTPALTEISSQSWNGVGIMDSMISPSDAYLASSVNRDANYTKTIRVDSTGL